MRFYDAIVSEEHGINAIIKASRQLRIIKFMTIKSKKFKI